MAGTSWMEAVFSTTRRQSSSLATPPEFFAIRAAAFRPRGVAAFPRPRRFAETLAETAERVSSSRLARGRRRRSRGRKSRASFPARPERSITSMTPVQRQITPAMDRQRVTAEAAPERAAADTVSSVPPRAPKSTETPTMQHQRTVIAKTHTSH